MCSSILLNNLNSLKTTKLGIYRIKRNLSLTTDDVVLWCKDQILSNECTITKKGKNFYAKTNNVIITVNSYSYTIITAHKLK